MNEHYFSAAPTSAAGERTIDVTLAGRTVGLRTARGVFSADRLDPGTAVLLRKAPAPAGPGTYLDLGCGYGPIACALALRAPAARVWAVDVNERARELAAANARALGLGGVSVAAPDDVPADVTFDEIWSNPPIHVGKDALHALLDRWLARLAPEGVAHLVVQRHLGADSLHRRLVAAGWACDRTASANGFRVLAVRRGRDHEPRRDG